MQWLFILMASISAALPLQDAVEPQSDKLPFLSDLAPIGSNSDVSNFLAFNSETNSESKPEIDTGTLKTSTQSSDNPAFNLNAQGLSLPSALFQSVPPLDLAFNSRIPEVHSNENPIDVYSGTVAQNSVSSCGSDSTQVTRRDKEMQCDITDPDYYIRPPQADSFSQTSHNSVQTPTGGRSGDSELLARKKRDLKWIQEHPDAIVSEVMESICAAMDKIIPRLLPFCCAWVVAWYPLIPWGPDITDEAGCVSNIVGRPWCEDWEHQVCCFQAGYTSSNTGNPLEWGWDGINCAPIH